MNFPWTLMNFIADHEAICLCIRWTALPNFATIWSAMAIDMSNERSQRDLSAKIKFKFSQIKNKLYNWCTLKWVRIPKFLQNSVVNRSLRSTRYQGCIKSKGMSLGRNDRMTETILKKISYKQSHDLGRSTTKHFYVLCITIHFSKQ